MNRYGHVRIWTSVSGRSPCTSQKKVEKGVQGGVCALIEPMGPMGPGTPESFNRAAAFHRCDGSTSSAAMRSKGLMMTVANPFCSLGSAAAGAQVTAGYSGVGIAITATAQVKHTLLLCLLLCLLL